MHQETPPAKVASNELLGPKVWARKDQLQHASKRGGLMCAMYPDTNGRSDLEPLYDQAVLDAAAAATHADYADGVRLMAAEVKRLRAALLEYMAAFGQGLEAHGIELCTQQIDADKQARAALHSAYRQTNRRPACGASG